MEYSFWGDESGLHLALHNRGSHHKSIVKGSSLAMLAVDHAAQTVLTMLRDRKVRAGDLKTIVVRCNQKGESVASLFVKPKSFIELFLPHGIKGLRVYHSSPQSPASVPTKLLQELGDPTLQDKLLGKQFTYDVDSFFQVNIPIFEKALHLIRGHVSTPELVDMYAGVGSIGLSVADKKVKLVELDPATANMALVNAAASGLVAAVVETSTEKALECITERPIVFDPPRAGLHDKIVSRVLEVMPQKIIYLSCNPATQARDLGKLQHAYNMTHFEVFNFFPHTPHIETLAILQPKP